MEHPADFETVFILTANREHAKRDRGCLKDFHPKTVVEFASGVEALDSWSFYTVDLLLLDTELTDMEGVKFLRLMRGDAHMRKVPVVMVTSENHKNKVLDAISAGCDGYIIRPYSKKTYENHLARAWQVERVTEIEEILVDEAREKVAKGDFDGAIDAFEEFFSEENQAQGYYDSGMRYLMEGKYGKAIAAFKKAVNLNDLYAEAYKGMAEAYKGKGDMESCQKYLQKAAEVFATIDRLEECRELFIEILKYDAQTPNPFNTLGVNLRKRGDVGGALRAYRQALELTPMDENIYFNMAKAYYFLGDKDGSLERLRQALSLNPSFAEGRALYEKLAGSPWPVPADEAVPEQAEDQPASMRDD